MANITTFTFDTPGRDPIPPDGTSFFTLGPADVFAGGAITVTAHPRIFGEGAGLAAMFMEVVQMATRKSISLGGGGFFIDVVVRNNSHVGTGEASIIEKYDVHVSVVTP